MSDVVQIPRVRCDNCAATADKVRDYDKQWKRPKEWGDVRVAPTHRGTYPNNIAMVDLCPNCLRLVHDAVGKALDAGRTALDAEGER